jgi:hypothetical protein
VIKPTTAPLAWACLGRHAGLKQAPGLESAKLCLKEDAHAIAWFATRFQPRPAPSRARRRPKTKKAAPKGGLRRSKHARVRGLGAVSSLEASQASRTTERMPRGKWLRFLAFPGCQPHHTIAPR